MTRNYTCAKCKEDVLYYQSARLCDDCKAKAEDDALLKAARAAITAWAEHHRDQHPGHSVWLHRRIYDIATSCMDCEKAWNEAYKERLASGNHN